jgi:hypothetical protein
VERTVGGWGGTDRSLGDGAKPLSWDGELERGGLFFTSDHSTGIVEPREFISPCEGTGVPPGQAKAAYRETLESGSQTLHD